VISPESVGDKCTHLRTITRRKSAVDG
jgi:hypothetical protein